MYRQTPHPKLSADLCADLRDTLVVPIAGSFITDAFVGTHLAFITRVVPWIAGATVRAVWLLPSQQIGGHADRLPAGTIRLHIPVKTNDQSWVLHDGVWQRLTLGLTYAMDPTLWHGAVNWGTEPRVHLLIE